MAICVTDELLEFVDEILRPERLVQYAGPDMAAKRSNVIEAMLAQVAYRMLAGKIHKTQIGAAMQEPARMLRLAAYYLKAERGEKSYSFVPGPFSFHTAHDKEIKDPTPAEIKRFKNDPANRMVMGPGGVML